MTWEAPDEPQIHSHLSDVLPDEHPLANEDVYCDECKVMLHAHNNECMQTWIEFEDGNFCTNCMGPLREVMYSNTRTMKTGSPT